MDVSPIAVGLDKGLFAEELGVVTLRFVTAWFGTVVETGMDGPETDVGEATGAFMGLKKGRERLPQPGIFTSQPDEISNNINNIAEKMDKLFKVSRNGVP